MNTWGPEKEETERLAQYDGSRLTPQDVVEGHDGTHGPCSICGIGPDGELLGLGNDSETQP